ncbi:MAG: ATP-grasp domain-containing protein [Candidatus Delongbacteria bacterium]|nr:ATP-grasp domain-containing protein [Candidatus Delongbacteria bacterium]
MSDCLRNCRKIGIIYDIPNKVLSSTPKKNIPSVVVSNSEINDIIQALTSLGYDVDIIDGLATLLNNKINIKKEFDLIFNKYIGREGLERKSPAPTICSFKKLPLIGSSAYTMTLARHKFHTNALLKGLGYPTPLSFISYSEKHMPKVKSYPVIVKPNHESDSLGISEESICFNQQEVEAKIVELHKIFEQPIVIEQYISGEEWKVGIIGNGYDTIVGDCVTTLRDNKPIINSLQTRNDNIYDRLIHQRVTAHSKLIKKAKYYAKEIHQAIGLNDYSRCDFRIGKDGKIYCMEISTHPYIGQINSSFIESLLKEIGTYSSILEEILNAGMKRMNIN